MKTLTYSQARQHLAGLMDEVCSDRAPVQVTRRGADAVVVMAASDYEGLMETLHLLGQPANAERLLRSIAEADAGQLQEHDPR